MYLACSGVEFYGQAFGCIVSQRADARIKMHTSPSYQMQPQQQNPLNGVAQMQMPQIPMAVQNIKSDSFDYDGDFDNNGLVYFLATKCNTQQWENPVQLGFISVRTSGLMHDSHPAHCVVGRKSVRCVTKSLKHAWIVIDFHDYAIKPSGYTLRHYASWDTEALRNWKLEGSLDGETWTVIRKHNNDESLRFKGQSYTWSLRNINSIC